MVEAYCVKCRSKKQMTNAKEVEINKKGGNKGRAMKGQCPTCSTTMFRIMGKK